MADNHAKHSAESHRLHLERVIPGSPLEDRLRAEGIVFPDEVAANHGLFSESGGAYDDCPE